MTFTQRMLTFYLQEASAWGMEAYRMTRISPANDVSEHVAAVYAQIAWRNAQIALHMLEQEVQS